MAQNATININAVDNTRGAFLAVQRNMQGVSKQLQINQSGLAMLARRYIGLTVVATAATRTIREVMTATESIKGLDPSVAASVALLRKDFEDLFGSLDGFANRAGARFIGFLGDTGRSIGRFIVNPFNSAARSADELNDRMVGLEITLRRIVASPQVVRAAKDSDDALKATTQTMIQLQQMGIELNSVVASVGPALSRGENVDALRVLDEQLQSVNTQIENLKSVSLGGEDEAPGRQDAIIAALAKQKELYEQIGRVGTRLIAQEKDRKKLARDAGKVLAEGFEEAAFSGKKLSGVIKQLGQDLLRLAFRNMITNRLADGITGGIGRIMGFASGGIPPTGRASIVGEKGPELFVPGTSGRIVPNHELSGNSGGGATYYIDARGADQTGLARLEGMIRETRASIKPIALASVIDARMRGGAMARAA